MTVLFVLVIVFGSIFGYLAVGWYLAKKDMPNAWRRARGRWTVPSLVRGSVKEQTVYMTLFWPVLGPTRLLASHLDSAISNRDPAELQRQLKERAQYIAKLERELGIGRNT